MRKRGWSSIEGSWEVFSQLRGSPSTVGKGSSIRVMLGCLETWSRMDLALDGVVMMVTLIFLEERAPERSSNGIVWP